MNNDKFTELDSALDKQNKILLSEYMVFCQYADSFDFNNYFRLEDLSESELASIFDFLYHEDCLLMLQKLINKYSEKLLYPDRSLLTDVNLRNDFDDRLAKLLTSENICMH